MDSNATPEKRPLKVIHRKKLQRSFKFDTASTPRVCDQSQRLKHASQPNKDNAKGLLPQEKTAVKSVKLTLSSNTLWIAVEALTTIIALIFAILIIKTL